MSINVTIKGNAVSIKRGKMVLSDLENIKKTEKEHRKRLRLEQVNEQSKAIAKKVLERARQVEQEQLNRLEKDGNTEMRRAHERKIMDMQRRLQDIENIGYAHDNAAMQPDVESIKQAEERRNKAIAEARGAEAVQQLQESKKAVSLHSQQQEALRKARETEKVRSQMVAQLPRKICISKDESLDTSENENIKTTSATCSRKKLKCVIPKKSPVRKVSKQTKKMHSKHSKTPSHISVSKSNEEISKTPTTTTSCMEEKNKANSPNKISNIPETVSDTVQEINRVCESDENEPRKTVPVTTPRKKEKFIRCHPQNSEDSSTSSLSSTSTTSSSISDDSSYYSENNSKTTAVRKTPRHPTSSVASKVSLYDHKTRQRNTYNTPFGLVERMNIKNKPNADDLAQEIIQLENKESETLANKRESIKHRSQDAQLRENIRRDYSALLKQLDKLNKIETKIQANQVSSSVQIPPPSKKCEDLAKQQKKMDRAFETILRSSRDPGTNDNRTERPITITPRDYIHSNPTPTTTWKEPPYIAGQETEESYSEEDSEFTHKRKISELLIKIEKLKRRLLQEYGADLPDEVFNASVRSLFQQSSTLSAPEKIEKETPKPPAPEIQVINMSGCDEAAKSARKVTAKVKKTSSNQTTQSNTNTNRHKRCQTPGKNVLKPSAESTVNTRDQQVQVELEPEKLKEEVISHPLEPVVRIITPENVDSSTSICSSNSSAATDLVIDVSKTEVTFLPKETEKTVKISKDRSVVSSVRSMQYTPGNAPVKISFEQRSASGSVKIARLVIDADKKKVTVIPSRAKASEETIPKETSPVISGKSHSLPGSRLGSPVKKHSRSAPPSRHSSPKEPCFHTQEAEAFEKKATMTEQKRYRTQYTQVSINSSTESSQYNSTSDTTNGRVYTRFESQRIITKLQDTSDASTTYASPPTIATGAFLKAMNRSTPILEFLDSSANETIKQRMSQVSPVSSPETPSPRTMMLPSNIPRGDSDNRRKLKFMSLISAHMTRSGTSGSVPKDTRPRQSTVKDKSTSMKPTSQTQPRISSQGQARSQVQDQNHDRIQIHSQDQNQRQSHSESQTQRPCHDQNQIQSQSEKCSCKNPACKLVHDKMDDAQSYTLKYCPQILKKYEDLQNVYTERIASLTDLIQKVRNEQKGLELSVMTNEDSNSVNQAPSSGQPSSNGQVGKLVKNIESIYSQLKRTLSESQKIISGEGIEIPCPIVPCREIEKSSSLSILSKDTLTSDSFDENVERAKFAEPETSEAASAKPKIINDERVHIQLDRFYSGKPQQDTVAKVDEATSTAQAPAVDAADQNEEMVKMLQNEILEQSKSINKSVPVDSLKDSDDSVLKSSQAPVKESDEASKNAASNDENNQSINLDLSNSDFVPLLAGIPKIARTSSKSSTNGRARPPVTLISGPYRPDIDSPAHELSTIVEFDTPDTANKSQVSTRSPSNRCRKRLPTGDAPQSTTASPSKADAKLTKRKPSVQVHPLPAHQSPQAFLNLSSKLSKSAEKSPRRSLEKSPQKSLEKSLQKSLEKSLQKSLEKSPRKSLETSPRNSLEKSPRRSLEKSPRKSIERSKESPEKKSTSNNEAKKSDSSDSMHSLPDVHIEHLQQSQDNADFNYEFRISQISELQSLPDENIDQMLISEICEESKSKSVTPVQRFSPNREPEQDKGQLTSTSSTSISGISGISEITTTPSSDVNVFKCPSSPEEMELALKKWGLGWAIPTWKKTREASALGSSSSSDVTPVNTAARLVSPVKKHQETTAHELPEISDVSSISIKHANKSTERSVLVKGRTSTPNRLSNSNNSNNSNNNSNNSNINSNNSNNNSDGTVSTLGSFDSELNIVVQNESAEVTIPNISFTNNKLL